MTIAEIQTLVVSADPPAKHYFTTQSGGAYTYWEETQRLPTIGDDHHIEQAWRFYVHRYTQDDFDQVADNIFEVLDNDPRTSVRHTIDYDPETDYIHHIFECEGY